MMSKHAVELLREPDGNLLMKEDSIKLYVSSENSKYNKCMIKSNYYT